MADPGGTALHGMSAADALAAVADMANPGYLSYDACVSPIYRSDWEWMEESYDVDRASVWALDSFGRTRFQLHGLTMRNSRAGRHLEHRGSRHAIGMNGKVSVCFTPGSLRLTFLDTAVAELVLGGSACSAG